MSKDDKDKIVLVDEKKDTETFVDNRDKPKELATELREKGLVIDLSNMSYAQAMQMAMTEAMFSRFSLLQHRLKLEDPTKEMFDELLTRSNKDMMQQVFTEAREQMASVVKKIPRDWFVSSAPADLDLSDPETYTHLRADKARELRRMIQKVETEAKN